MDRLLFLFAPVVIGGWEGFYETFNGVDWCWQPNPGQVFLFLDVIVSTDRTGDCPDAAGHSSDLIWTSAGIREAGRHELPGKMFVVQYSLP